MTPKLGFQASRQEKARGFAGRVNTGWGENPIVSASIRSYRCGMEENEITHFEGLEDYLVLTQNSDLGQAFGGSLGQTDGKNDLSHAKERSLRSNLEKHEKRHGKPQPRGRAERASIGAGG
jgi:hypothetical protein